jgi:hypothetical protein
MIGGLIGLVTVGPVVHYFGVIGAAIAFLLVQLYNTIALIGATSIAHRCIPK